MRVLVDIVHPADVLFFHRAIDRLEDAGDEVRIVSRHKDVTADLLDRFRRIHEPISEAATGIAGLGLELITRDLRLAQVINRWKPDVMIGFGGVAISHCGKLFGVPSISFYDSEGAHLQNQVTWPLISRLYVPEAYYGKTPSAKTGRIAGVKELSYLHPATFELNTEKALSCGYDPSCDNFFIRIVSWRANHDIGKSGLTTEALAKLVRALCGKGVVHISSEAPLPDEFEPLKVRGGVEDVHHLLGHCRLYFGESATMASEAAILGVPSVFAGRHRLGYIDELVREGLVSVAPLDEATDPESVILSLLARSADEYRQRRDAYVASRPDWADCIIEAINEFRPDSRAEPDSRRKLLTHLRLLSSIAKGKDARNLP